MIVIKIGGSLVRPDDTLLNTLNRVEQKYQGRAVVIVPGGGAFADQVRMAQEYWRFDDKIAHNMAILAMQQMALMFKGIKDGFAIATSVADIGRLANDKKTVIWSPNILELDNAGIEASWDVTSDSLAAWLAQLLAATELVLLKSPEIDQSLSLIQLAERGVIDKAFCGFAEQAAFSIRIVSHNNW